MAFPHPKSRKHHYRKEDEPNSRGVIWYLVKRTINITDYRNADDDVNPANNRTFGGLFHDWAAIYFKVRANVNLKLKSSFPFDNSAQTLISSGAC